jgi:Urate oxidase N-terminal
MNYELSEWLNLTVRWFHVFVGILWIGQTFLFTWMDRTLDREESLWLVHSGGFYIGRRIRWNTLHAEPRSVSVVSAGQRVRSPTDSRCAYQSHCVLPDGNPGRSGFCCSSCCAGKDLHREFFPTASGGVSTDRAARKVRTAPLASRLYEQRFGTRSRTRQVRCRIWRGLIGEKQILIRLWSNFGRRANRARRRRKIDMMFVEPPAANLACEIAMSRAAIGPWMLPSNSRSSSGSFVEFFVA